MTLDRRTAAVLPSALWLVLLLCLFGTLRAALATEPGKVERPAQGSKGAVAMSAG